jgi:hypothetical protein
MVIKTLKRAGLAGLVLAGVAGSVLASPLVVSDIRQEPLGDPAEAQATMEAAWRAHGGLERWREHSRVELELQGQVPLWPARQVFGIEDEQVSVTLRYDPSVWGEGTLSVNGGADVELDPAAPNLLADSVRHLVELSFSMDSADVLHALPQVDGHRRVFASWGEAAPQRDVDQYILWFNAEGILTRFDSTGRAIAPFIKARVGFEDYQDVAGFQLPGRVEVRRAGEDGALVHAWTLRSVHLEP